MLLLSAKIKDQSVLSLRTGGQVAIATAPIINPNNLKIVGFHCNDKFSGSDLVLLAQDIREQISQGFVVNDHEVLAEADDLVRLKQILEIDYDLIGKVVVSDQHRKIGKVADFAVDSESLYIQKIYVTPKLLKSLAGSSQISIDRTQVIEVTDKEIVVKEATEPATEPATAQLPA